VNNSIVLDKHEMVIDRDYYEKLQKDSIMLECLDTCKVTSWSGYDAAFKLFEKRVEVDDEEYVL
jgi:hypothetical protein